MAIFALLSFNLPTRISLSDIFPLDVSLKTNSIAGACRSVVELPCARFEEQIYPVLCAPLLITPVILQNLPEWPASTLPDAALRPDETSGSRSAPLLFASAHGPR